MARKAPAPTPATIVWFRSDLRLSDNAALTAAIERGCGIVPVFIYDTEAAGRWAPGGASRWWLHHSLAALARDLERLGSRLVLRRGTASDVLPAIARETGASLAVCSRRYEPWAIAQEQSVRDRFAADGVDFKRYPGGLLMEPERMATGAGEPYKVYTPFWRALSQRHVASRPLSRPSHLSQPSIWPPSEDLSTWRLLPQRPNWAQGFAPAWQPGEAGALDRLDRFLESAVSSYAEDRNRPDLEATSRLSPHLAHGEISPRLVWWRVAGLRGRDGAAAGSDKGLETFLKELVWREFSAHLLFHFPKLPDEPFRPEFARFPWRPDAHNLEVWQRGKTGYPIVDAGMRQLWATGWMHNRVRMIVASFLIKDLLIPWQQGEAWFWDTLVDADLANNAASWQWVAGSGADAAPYFRVFNPTTQGEKFDPQGRYVRAWVAELTDREGGDVHQPLPGKAPPDIFIRHRDGAYPPPIVDHAQARECALAAFQSLKKSGAD
ncbi:MAG: deoxyribodipyrimidine photo-lyase [Hyphomicrobiaceae bacterium]|nr:deoxyribodipyrimidine photo-lyase [Hyphomicrobiaceae bacterium]